MTVEHTVASWRYIAERLRSGKVRFSTGSQERGAFDLACFIDENAHGDDDDLVGLDLGYDEALSVTQAAGFACVVLW